MNSADNSKRTDFENLNYKNSNLSIQINSSGSDEYTKISFPIKYGIFSRLETSKYIFEFNLNNEIIHAKSKARNWIHPSEWLKRTMGNDWVYYSTGGYSGVYEAIGEYYLPNLQYSTNSLLGGKPFETGPIKDIITNWHNYLSELDVSELPPLLEQWMKAIKQKTPATLKKKAQKLFEITGSRVNVMPPDARHVDYNLIPVSISDGCLYKCRFCKVKNQKPFSSRSEKNINSQIKSIKKLYGQNSINYNALFLGEHDALNAPDNLIIDTIKKADSNLYLQDSFMQGRFAFLFGSVHSLLNKNQNFFSRLDQTGFQSYINIGLESNDQKTLDFLGKPLTPGKIELAFKEIQRINSMFQNIEITCNFIMDDDLPDSHYPAIMKLIREYIKRPRPKGTVYLSPLKFGCPSRQTLYDFYKLKSQSRFPTYLYLIQRL